MEAVKDKWTDERLDDLSKKVDDGFTEMRAEFRAQTRLFIGLYATVILAVLGILAGKGVTALREKWTDERLDDLNKKVDDGFADMRAEFRGVRGEINEFRGEVRTEIRFMTRLFIGLYCALILTIVAQRL